MDIRTRRVYEAASGDDGYRVLVDRVWPRGVTKEKAAVDLWLKDAAPTDALRKWFGHDPAKWDEFRERYFKELDSAGPAVEKLLGMARERRLTLVFGARDVEHNNAVALKEYLTRKKR